MVRTLSRALKVLSLLGVAALAVGKLRQGSAPRGAVRARPSVDTWPEVPRRS